MRIYNRYIVSLAAAASLVNTILALTGQNDLFFYLTVNLLAFLAITLFFGRFNPRADRALNLTSVIYVAVFVIVLGYRAITAVFG